MLLQSAEFMGHNDDSVALFGKFIVNDMMNGRFCTRVKGGYNFIQENYRLYT